jgi:hypothetical protein
MKGAPSKHLSSRRMRGQCDFIVRTQTVIMKLNKLMRCSSSA